MDFEEHLEAEDETVYISNDRSLNIDIDTKYHSSPTCATERDSNRVKMTRVRAEGQGFEPCEVCYQRD